MSELSGGSRTLAIAKRPARALVHRLSAHFRAAFRADLDDVAQRIHTDTLITSEFYALIDRRLAAIEQAIDDMEKRLEHLGVGNAQSGDTVAVAAAHQDSRAGTTE